MIQPYFALGRLQALLKGPAPPRHRDQRLNERAYRRKVR
jgi:hypothetical protein